MKVKCAVICIVMVLALSVNVFASEIPYGFQLIPSDTDISGFLPAGEAPAGFPYTVSERDWFVYDLARKAIRSQTNIVWSPDGGTIAFSNVFPGATVWIADIDENIPRLLYYNTYEIDGNLIPATSTEICCFTPDGTEVIFAERTFDSDKGGEVTVDYHDSGYGISPKNHTHVLKAVNIATGDIRVIAEGDRALYSPDYRYFVYTAFDHRIYTDPGNEEHHKHLAVIDTQTGETVWHENVPGHWYTFTADSKALLINDNNNIKRFDIITGETTYTGMAFDSTTNKIATNLDGTWIMTTGNGGARSNIIETEDGVRGYSTSDINKLHMGNLATHEFFSVFPMQENVESSFGSFSPDGSKFAYIRKDYDGSGRYEIYIAPFEPELILNLHKSVGVEEAQPLPTQVDITGISPNPFNPSTTISFILGNAAFTELTIYNISGQKVRTLIDSHMSQGTHNIVWNGCDDNGNKLSSGVYISTIRQGHSIASRHVTLLK